ncbi:MAG: DUF4162 domain-containing protein, partial [Bacteroidota bacterium]
SSFDRAENQLDFTIKLPTSETTGILAQLSKEANVNHFEETIPSANDIFIQTVNHRDNGQ